MTGEGGTRASDGQQVPPLIELVGVTKGFGGRPVLRGLDLAVERGEIFTLLGGSGSGKSVLLKHMVGLLRPDAGRIAIDGRDSARFGEREWVAVRRRVAYVFQGAALFDSLSVKENIAYGLREHLVLDEAGIDLRVAECLDAVGLAGIESRMPAELSGGMRKRVAVARALALAPEVILYDEPTTGLDPANARRIGQLIASLRRELGGTAVIVTHDLELAFAISDRVGMLAGGRLIAVGTCDAIRASRLPEVQEFLAGELEAPAARTGGA